MLIFSISLLSIKEAHKKASEVNAVSYSWDYGVMITEYNKDEELLHQLLIDKMFE
jgi:hypothetical protein